MSWDDDLAPPADPWAGQEPTFEDDELTLTLPDPTLVEPVEQTTAGARRTARRRLYGCVYQNITATDPNKYIGKAGPRKRPGGGVSPASPARRVNEHRTSKEWGHEILPGRRGYRVLEWVEESGRGAAYDAANLAYREAIWIARLNPTENILRPVPIPPEQALARAEARAQRSTVRTTATPARRPIAWFRLVSFLLWTALYTTVLAWVLHFSPIEWLPLLALPLGALMGRASVWAVRREWDRMTRPKARPPARRRTRRRRKIRW
jgi:hypothetical protein